MDMKVLLGLARHILTTLGGGLVTSGYLVQNDLTAIVGGIIALAGVVLSIMDKKK